MSKKVFLQKNLQKGGGGSPYLKYLLIAAVGLLLLVIVTPYMLKGKKELPRRAVPEKGLLKELPKPPEPPPQAVPEQAKPVEQAKPAEPMKPIDPARPPETLKPAEPIPAVPPKPAVESPPLAQTPPAAPEKTQLPQPQPAGPSETAPKDPFPKKGASPAKIQPGPEPKTASPAQPAKPDQAGKVDMVFSGKPPANAPKDKAAAGKQMYAVQVGSFKDKNEAETVQRSLAKKGYSVFVAPSKPGGQQAYTVMTRPVDSMSKASTLAVQMKGEVKTNPAVIKASDTAGGAPALAPARKPVAKKPEAQKPGIQKPDAQKPAVRKPAAPKPKPNGSAPQN